MVKQLRERQMRFGVRRMTGLGWTQVKESVGSVMINEMGETGLRLRESCSRSE